MLSNNLEQLYFSQSALATYQRCALKFRYRYLEGLYWPRDWSGDISQKSDLEKGNLFHLLARRYYNRGEEFPSDLKYPELKKWFIRLKEMCPFNREDNFLPEYEIRINQAKRKMVAKFDLLYFNKNKDSLLIYDWKTNRKEFSDNIDKNLKIQSRFYLYVLCEAVFRYQYFADNDFQTDRLKLIFWNPRFPGQKKQIGYSKVKYRRDKKYFNAKIKEIKNLEYNQFEAVADLKICSYCEYRPVCYNKKAKFVEPELDDLELGLQWQRIDEVGI